MNIYLFILDRKSKKFVCPGCKRKTFVRFIDNATNEYLPEKYGRCDREIKCSYFLNPYKDGFVKKILKGENGHFVQNQRIQLITSTPVHKQNIIEPAFIPVEILKATQKGYEQNTFIQNLLNNVSFPFEAKDIEQIISLYHLGTICKGYRKGAITFPFIDINGNVRAIQAKQFDKTNHTMSTDFLHSIYERDCKKNNKPYPVWLNRYLLTDQKVSCLFGEHLLRKYSKNPIALVEAPKTAIIGTLYFGSPDNSENLLWLAVYNLSSLTFKKCKILSGRKVYFFPDLNAFENWSNKAKKFQKDMPRSTFKVSNLLEFAASQAEKEKGLDIADYLLRFDAKDFKPCNKSFISVDSDSTR